jgi:hypothetical protein
MSEMSSSLLLGSSPAIRLRLRYSKKNMVCDLGDKGSNNTFVQEYAERVLYLAAIPNFITALSLGATH